MALYTVIKHKQDRKYTITGTINELVEAYRYTLETGKSYEKEKGNKKINTKPTTINSLITNLNKAVDNAACNGYSGVQYTYEEVV